MPANVLEKPTAVEAPCEAPKTGSSTDSRELFGSSTLNQSDREPLNVRQRTEFLLRKVFEGREEFLGWTPD